MHRYTPYFLRIRKHVRCKSHARWCYFRAPLAHCGRIRALLTHAQKSPSGLSAPPPNIPCKEIVAVRTSRSRALSAHLRASAYEAVGGHHGRQTPLSRLFSEYEKSSRVSVRVLPDQTFGNPSSSQGRMSPPVPSRPIAARVLEPDRPKLHILDFVRVAPLAA